MNPLSSRSIGRTTRICSVLVFSLGKMSSSNSVGARVLLLVLVVALFYVLLIAAPHDQKLILKWMASLLFVICVTHQVLGCTEGRATEAGQENEAATLGHLDAPPPYEVAVDTGSQKPPPYDAAVRRETESCCLSIACDDATHEKQVKQQSCPDGAGIQQN